MRKVINLNGMTKEQHLHNHQAVIDALSDTMIAMEAVRPHGRDYQTLPNASEAYDADLDVYSDRFAQLDRLRNEFQEDYYTLYAQGRK